VRGRRLHLRVERHADGSVLHGHSGIRGIGNIENESGFFDGFWSLEMRPLPRPPTILRIGVSGSIGESGNGEEFGHAVS
jgi:hypothetical protein